MERLEIRIKEWKEHQALINEITALQRFFVIHIYSLLELVIEINFTKNDFIVKYKMKIISHTHAHIFFP